MSTQHERGVGVAKVVEPNVGKAGPGEERTPPGRKGVRVKRGPVAPVDHEVGLAPGWAGPGSAAFLTLPLPKVARA